MGAEMADLVQGGLIGLLRGIEKFDSTTKVQNLNYVYWWISLPNHLHERLGLIRNAKIRLEEKGVTPSIDGSIPSLNGLPGETHHSEEVNKLIDSTLQEREKEIIRLYHGLDKECLTWEDISKRMGLSRERVRQVGLVAVEKLKHACEGRVIWRPCWSTLSSV
uniref:RNA polymerase sigma-70 domain-containing protein n=1 Tax=Salix viminalis TaxID=40686 RepID=A0A6N2KLG6_SALVM